MRVQEEIKLKYKVILTNVCFKLNPPRNRSSPFIKINILGLDFVMRFVLKVIKTFNEVAMVSTFTFLFCLEKRKKPVRSYLCREQGSFFEKQACLGTWKGKRWVQTILILLSHLPFICSFWYFFSGALNLVILAFIAGVSEKCQHAIQRQCSFKQNLDGILPTSLYVIFNITIAKTP